MSKPVIYLEKNSFNFENHYYEKVRSAILSPAVNLVLDMNIDRIIERYAHLNPSIDKDRLSSFLKYKPSYFRWAGGDLFNVTDEHGKRNMVLIETNSCPSGQKSVPFCEHNEKRGYETLIRNSIAYILKEKKEELPEGVLCVIYDKNYMEASGYAAVMADVFEEKIYLVECNNKYTKKAIKKEIYQNGNLNSIDNSDKEAYEEENVKVENGIVYIKFESNWLPARAIFRYVTQKPWNRLPLISKTLIFNPIVACLAGGRNKLVADMAYEIMNSELSNFTGLKINTPHTIRNVKLNEVPLWIKSFGGLGVVKNPYSNAGQGVWTITNYDELNSFMNEKHDYEEFIVQALIGNYKWSSQTPDGGRLFHVGTLPNKQNQIFVADLRMMVFYDYKLACFRPLIMYGRKALKNLPEYLDESSSWDVLGTNLTMKLEQDKWDSDTSRLIIMDHRGFNEMGMGVDDLIDAFIQTVLAVVAIDKMCIKLMNNDGFFNIELFKSLNPDEELLKEIKQISCIYD